MPLANRLTRIRDSVHLNAIMEFQVILIVFCLCLAGTTSQGEVPRLEGVKPDVGYHALVKENERKVEVTPRIKVVDAEACAFLVTNKHHGEIPFVVQLTDRVKGEAELVAKKELDCEKRKSYRFDIAAISCDDKISENITVHLTVVDVNEHPPVFSEESYLVSVDEDKLYDKILQVEADDQDCTPTYSDICKYEILQTNQPFEIDTEGRIKNTEPLSWNRSRNHILSVVAYDCGMKRSKPVTVNIKVNRVCRLGWKEVRERVEYTPGSGQRTLFPQARLELCDVPCEVEKLVTKISLTTRHIGKGCDRDTYSVESQRKLCGASSDSVDLLPSPGIGTEWTRGLPTDEGHESDQIYEFDGATNAVVIPETTLSHNLTDNFTAAFWMKHEPLSDSLPGGGGRSNHSSSTGGQSNNAHTKEHIICNADDHKMNRHHYAIFVRNCRLILLLRREFYQERPSVFRPAEWRWKLAEVCDDQWHHYAISVSFPEATLYVDGQPFKVQTSNPEIIDDWPLHAARGINSTLVVGACWQGKDNKMAFHFRGFLAGLSILRGRTESPEVLACLHRCKEGLEVPPAELLEPGMELLTNSDSSEVTVEGNSKSVLEELVSHVAYMNSREFPTPGRRNLVISTSVTCQSGKTIKVPSLSAYVMVEQPEQPSITINGTPNLAREYEAFKQGVDLFASVSVLVSQDTQEEDEEDDEEDDADEADLQDLSKSDLRTNGALLSLSGAGGKEHKLDSCTVQVYPPLNPDHEYFRLPNNLMTHLGIHRKESKEGLLIYGADTIHNYELVLRQILYFNRKPAYYLNRAFKLVCSELNGRFVSNEYIQTLTVIHPRAEPSQETKNKQLEAILPASPASAESLASNVALARVDGHEVEFKDAKTKSASYLDSNSVNTGEAIAKTSASHAVTIIIVVCVGFLVFMIVLGVIRIRAAHHRAQETRDEDQEMAWDDSSLTITVNPMDQIEQEQEVRPQNEEDEDSDSSEDGSSYHDEIESSEEEPEKAKGRELEWDDSTLTF